MTTTPTAIVRIIPGKLPKFYLNLSFSEFFEYDLIIIDSHNGCCIENSMYSKNWYEKTMEGLISSTKMHASISG